MIIKETYSLFQILEKGVFLNVLSQLRDFNNFKIKGLYVDENEFFNKIQSLSEIRFTTTNNIFQRMLKVKRIWRG